MENKLIQIWEDTNHETALYPSTLAEGVKWDSTTTLPQYLGANLGAYCVDSSRMLLNANPKETTITYTATEDCYVCCYCISGYNINVAVNGVMLNGQYNCESLSFYLKRGDVLTSSCSANSKCRVFGLKKGDI